MNSYAIFLKTHSRFLSFGFLAALLCGFGQTFFIGLYNQDIRTTYGLSEGDFGLYYGIATFISALCLMQAGKLIDHIPLTRYILGVLAIMISGCLFIGLSSTLWLLMIGIFLMRFSGQGLMSHAAFTSMARYFDAEKGRATSIAGIGMCAHVVLFPVIAYAAIAAFGWQESWILYAIALALFAVPLFLFLLKNHYERHDAWQASEERAQQGHADQGVLTEWTRKKVLSDWRFYVILLVVLCPPGITTALFFFLQNIADDKGWSMVTISTSFSALGVAALVASFLTGFFIDRLNARALLPFFLLPYLFGVFFLWYSDHIIAPFVFMAGFGLTEGMMGTLIGPLWKEMYGARHLGAIKALVHGIMVAITAATPVLFGQMIDSGIVLLDALPYICLFMIFAALMQFFVTQHHKKQEHTHV